MAMRAALSPSPLWLLEGFADYVALAHVDLPVSRLAEPDRSPGCAQRGPPDRLPTQDDFGPRQPGARSVLRGGLARLPADRRAVRRAAARRVLPGLRPRRRHRRGRSAASSARPSRRSPGPGGPTCVGSPARPRLSDRARGTVGPVSTRGTAAGATRPAGRAPGLARRPAVLTAARRGGAAGGPRGGCWCPGPGCPVGTSCRGPRRRCSPRSSSTGPSATPGCAGGWAGRRTPRRSPSCCVARADPPRQPAAAPAPGPLVGGRPARRARGAAARAGRDPAVRDRRPPHRPGLRHQPPGVDRMVARRGQGAGGVLGRDVPGAARARRPARAARRAGGSRGRGPPRWR